MANALDRLVLKMVQIPLNFEWVHWMGGIQVVYRICQTIDRIILSCRRQWVALPPTFRTPSLFPPSHRAVLGLLQEDVPLQLSETPHPPPYAPEGHLGHCCLWITPHPQGSRPQIGPSCEVGQLGAFWPPDLKSCCPHCHWTKQMTNHLTQHRLDALLLLIFIIQTLWQMHSLVLRPLSLSSYSSER